MSHHPAARYLGTEDKSVSHETNEDFGLDSVDFDAIEEINNAKVDQQEDVEVDNDCGDACKI